MTTPTTNALYAKITARSMVTFLDHNDQKRRGRAVMKGPYGWVLNMGGRHGTPKVIDDRAVITAVSTAR